tara:strand:+ start:955 stop:1269 length:315 start_codon:yes stop_codon:yes gene_type:complete
LHPKYQNHRNEKYLEWIRRQPSIVSDGFDAWDMDRGEGRNDPSHTWNTGKKGKRNDYLAVPLTRKEHRQYHDIGHDEFAYQHRHKIDFLEECFKLLCRYTDEIS